MSTELIWMALALCLLLALVTVWVAGDEPPALRVRWAGRLYAHDPRAQLAARPHIPGTLNSVARAARAYYRWKWTA